MQAPGCPQLCLDLPSGCCPRWGTEETVCWSGELWVGPSPRDPGLFPWQLSDFQMFRSYDKFTQD